MKLVLKSPLKVFKITQRFGNNFNSFYVESGMKGHNGMDLQAPDGTSVYATHDGRVTFAGYDGSGGLGVVIRTLKKFDYEGKQSYYKTIYWHLKKGSLKVTGGQDVKCGQLIAEADNTGRSTGSHLHFALKPIAKGEADWSWYNSEQNNGYFGAIDPLPFFESTPTPEPVITQTLRFGSKGPQVKELQKIFNLVADGIFGPKTKGAVVTFQKAHGLVPDGIVGPKTRAVLNS